ncbi:hypothetical protein [Saccharothrix deserti]|uniref:hypothetical protein n=1 Tax=Saccharothrix deserti TaxID=2593674 RepID=UPI00131C3FB2|nr:hypothetical protein [Saccharothrix deserti]
MSIKTVGIAAMCGSLSSWVAVTATLHCGQGSPLAAVLDLIDGERADLAFERRDEAGAHGLRRSATGAELIALAGMITKREAQVPRLLCRVGRCAVRTGR